MTKLLNRQDVREYEEQRMSRVSRFTMRRSKRREIKNCQEFPLLWKLLASIYSLFSFVTRRWQGKEVRSPREKPDFPRHPPPRMTNVISQNVLGTILLRKCFKDLTSAQYVMDELGALYVSYRAKCKRYAMKDEYAMFAFSLLRLRDIFIALYISSRFILSTIQAEKYNEIYFNLYWLREEKYPYLFFLLFFFFFRECAI